MGAPFSSTIGCTDLQGHQVADTRHGIIPQTPEDTTDNSSGINQTSEEPESKTSLLIGAGIGVIILAILAITILVIWIRSPKDEFGDLEEIHENVGWAAPSDSRVEGEQNVALAEMAMGAIEEVTSLSNNIEDVEEELRSEFTPDDIEEEPSTIDVEQILQSEIEAADDSIIIDDDLTLD